MVFYLVQYTVLCRIILILRFEPLFSVLVYNLLQALEVQPPLLAALPGNFIGIIESGFGCKYHNKAYNLVNDYQVVCVPYY